MKVKLIAATTQYDVPEGWQDESYTLVRSADLVGEIAGRICYQSFNRPSPKTATNVGYLENILEKQHFSVLEHASATFYITGVSRNLTHELIRHRHLSFSEMSQRYVDMSKYNPVTPPLYADRGWVNPTDTENYQGAVRGLESYNNYTRKEVREAARCELPSSMETRILVTGNHRAWREVLGKRGSLAADREIRELAVLLFKSLVVLAPNTYQDFVLEGEGKWEHLSVRQSTEESNVKKPDGISFMKAQMEVASSIYGMTPQEAVEALQEDPK